MLLVALVCLVLWELRVLQVLMGQMVHQEMWVSLGRQELLEKEELLVNEETRATLGILENQEGLERMVMMELM